MADSPTVLKEIIISKEDAVFWMDEDGRWHNRHGRFQHAKIITHFNASIKRDSDGYFVEQINGATREKVYFRYKETAYFAVGLKPDEPPALVLNTGKTIPLRVDDLFVVNDRLYQRWDGHFIKFSERLLLEMADRIDCRGEHFFFRSKQQWQPIENYSDVSVALYGGRGKGEVIQPPVRRPGN